MFKISVQVYLQTQNVKNHQTLHFQLNIPMDTKSYVILSRNLGFFNFF